MSFKPVSDEAFSLVKKLTDAEGRYFIQYLNRQRLVQRDSYLSLFKLLSISENYNEDEIKKHPSISELASRFSYHKNTFINYIIESLLAFREQSLTESKIHRYLESAIILYEKRLYLQGLKILERARKEATLYEKLYLLLEICENERKMLKEIGQSGLGEDLKRNSLEKKEIWQKIENEDSFSAINDKVFMLYRELNQMKDVEKLMQLDLIIKDPLLKDKNRALTFDTQLKFNYIHSFYHRLKGNVKESRQYRENVIIHWNKHPHMISEMPVRYREDLSSLLSSRHLTRDYNGFDDLIKRIENIKTAENPEDDASVFREVYYLRLLYLLNTGKKEDALDLIPEIEQGLNKNIKFIGHSRVLNFYYNIAVTYFINCCYKEALIWVERILSTDKNSKIRTDLYDFSSILEIVLHFETGKFELVEYRIRNTRAKLKKQNKLYDFEKIVLSYLGRFLNQEDKKKVAVTWKQFLEKLNEFKQSPETENLLGLEEITLWVEGKIVS